MEKAKTKEDKTKAKGDAKSKMKEGKAAMMNNDLTYPYTAAYSSQFEMGDPANAQLILNIWKDWDDNAFERHADMFADTVMMIFPSGQVVKGKDSALAGATRFRGSLTSAKSTVQAWIPVRSIDKNENWVCVWGYEDDVLSDGTKATNYLQEIWRINKDGKIDFMRQYQAKPAMMNE